LTIIAGKRVYDGLGRVVFEADPYPVLQAFATAYGTTHFFKPDGTPSCFIRGNGQQPSSLLKADGTAVTNESLEIYPTCFQRAFQNGTEVVNVRDPSSLLAGSPQDGVVMSSYSTAIGRLISRSTWQGSTRLEHATFDHDRLGRLTRMTRYQDANGAANPVATSWRFDSFGQLVELDEPYSAPQFRGYSSWGELQQTYHARFDPQSPFSDPTGTDVIDIGDANTTLINLVNRYDALGRLVHSEQQNNGVADPDTVNDYAYDQAVTVAPQVTPTNMLGRLAQATSPTGTVSFSYDAFGRPNARVFTDNSGGSYIEKHTFRGDGAPTDLDLFLPDTGFADEHVHYVYDSAGRGKSATYTSGPDTQSLFAATTVDVLGRLRDAQYGAAHYLASYADTGRRLLNQVSVSSPLGSRSISYQGYDPVGRERSRNEVKDGSGTGTATSFVYDALGRLSSATQLAGAVAQFDQHFGYDPLGNILSISDTAGVAGATSTTLSYLNTDRDRICHIAYGSDSDTACNVVYDEVGNITSQHTATGTRQYAYFGDGNIRTISDDHGSVAHFRYDAFGEVQELDLTSTVSPDTRHDRNYGSLIARRDVTTGGATSTVWSRKIPGPGGLVATRHGAGGPWTFAFGEARGNRFFTDEHGAFVQDVDYQPFGTSKSTGAQPGSNLYSNEQWNGGDTLAAFGISKLGARLYDPAIGRFLSRDPLLIPRTSATTNPYAFANNDPVNASDRSGMAIDTYRPEEESGCRQHPEDCQGQPWLIWDEPVGAGIDTSIRGGNGGGSDSDTAQSSFPVRYSTANILNLLGYTTAAAQAAEILHAGQELAREMQVGAGPYGPAIAVAVLVGTAILAAAVLGTEGMGDVYCGPANGPVCDDLMLESQLRAAAQATAADAPKPATKASRLDAIRERAETTQPRIHLFRGLTVGDDGYELATRGIVLPPGGHSDPDAHNEGDTQSVFTAWTTSKDLAEHYALDRGHGVVLDEWFPLSRLVRSPDRHKESEVLVIGAVVGANVRFAPEDTDVW
jgi:RHS repeat-associated protein